jgi:hypothetical protein
VTFADVCATGESVAVLLVASLVDSAAAATLSSCMAPRVEYGKSRVKYAPITAIAAAIAVGCCGSELYAVVWVVAFNTALACQRARRTSRTQHMHRQ